MEEIIQISHAVKRFGKATVLQDVSLNVKKGNHLWNCREERQRENSII